MDAQELADASRVFLDHLVRAKAPAEDQARAMALIEEATALLAPHVPAGPRNMYEGFHESADFLDLFRLNPVIGRLNPVAPRFEISFREGGGGYQNTEVVARAELGILFEGPIDGVHGGIIASLFDQFLAIANIHNGFGAFTGTLTVKYLQPCPLFAPLTFVCRTDRVEGRKVHTVGELQAGDVRVAEASGLFILPSEARLAELIGQNERVSGQSAADMPAMPSPR